jgi:hypothetical protein
MRKTRGTDVLESFKRTHIEFLFSKPTLKILYHTQGSQDNFLLDSISTKFLKLDVQKSYNFVCSKQCLTEFRKVMK